MLRTIPLLLLVPALAWTSEPGVAAPAETATENSWGEVIQFEVVGFFIVMGTLAGLWLICELTGSLFKRLDAKRVAASCAATPAPAPTDNIPVTATHIPVIAAAVAAALDGDGYRIVAVKPAQTDWSQAGRRDHFGSHRLR
ncbi:MAG: OadG family transporter subunit [Planctomycetota bacterium]|jgi:hypothetical protein